MLLKGKAILEPLPLMMLAFWNSPKNVLNIFVGFLSFTLRFVQIFLILAIVSPFFKLYFPNAIAMDSSNAA